MNLILTPPQRRALIAVDTFLASGRPRATIHASRQCGLTTLLNQLRDVRGVGSEPTEFIVASSDAVIAKANADCRTVFLVDRAVEFSLTADAGQTIIFTEPSFMLPVIELAPMTKPELQTFLDRSQLTMQGRMVTYTDHAIEQLHTQSEGRIAILSGLMARVLETAKHLGQPQIDTRLVEACRSDSRQAA